MLVIGGIISIVSGIRAFLKKQVIEISEDYIELKRKKKQVLKLPLSSISKVNWVFISKEDSGSMWSDAYKEKGLCLLLDDTKIVLEKYENGLYKCFKERIGDLVPELAIYARDIELNSKTDLLAIIYPNENYYIGKTAEYKFDFSLVQNELHKPLLKLRCDNEGKLFIKLLTKCALAGSDSISKNKFNIERQACIDITSLPEYEVSEDGFKLEGLYFFSKRLEDLIRKVGWQYS